MKRILSNLAGSIVFAVAATVTFYLVDRLIGDASNYRDVFLGGYAAAFGALTYASLRDAGVTISTARHTLRMP